MNHIRQGLFIIMSFLPLLAGAQITSNAFYSEVTSYPDGNDDPIFYYTSMTNAQLIAPSGAGYTYNWFSYNASTNAFDVLEQTGGNVLMTVSEKGYRVEVNSGSNTMDYFCWNFVPEYSLDSIGMPTETCDNIRLMAYAQTKPLVYYDHKGSDITKAIVVDYGYNWTSNPTGPMDGVTNVSELIAAPFEDTNYQVELGAKFADGFEPVILPYFYEAIAVKAAFTFEPEDPSKNEANEGSAPMEVRFSDDSKGKVTDWFWEFGANGQTGAGLGYDSTEVYSFRYAGEYPVTLTVKNLSSHLGCESVSPQEIFKIKEIAIKVPGAFTPFSSPGENDEFKVLYRSVKKYSIIIYNRWGRKVYTGTDPSQGWDGRIGGRKAEPGVYFYTIRAEGYNEGERLRKEGAVHLIVTK